MTWLPDFGRVAWEAVRLRKADEWLAGARNVVLAGDPDRLLDAFPGGVRIDDPRGGRIEGRADLEAYCEQSATWLHEHQAQTRPIAATIGLERTIGEFEVDLTAEGRTFALPVAVVVEPDPAHESVWIRSYHSQWPLLRAHAVRPPILSRDPEVRESDVVGEYQAALAVGDVARIVATFEPDGCFREPAGPQYRVCGTTALTELMTRFFSVGGGIVLEHCTVTEDGVRSALEFNAVRWGSTDMPHQAGIAVYERGRSGRLAHARIYDDVSPPL